MPLKAVVDTLDQVPEAVRGEYVQKDGKFVLAIEGVPPGFVPGTEHATTQGKLVEFRDTNKKLMAALGIDTAAGDAVDKALQRATVYAGIDPAKLERLKVIDPDEYERLKAEADKLKGKGIENADQIEARLKAMVTAALKPVQDELAAEKTLRTEAQQRADKALLRQTIGDAFTKAGGHPGALDFILGRAEESFRVVENAVKAADNKFSAQKAGEPLGVDEWMAGAVKEHAFAFNPSGGGGANGSGGGPRPATTPPSTFKTPGGKEVRTEGISVLAS